MKFREHTVSRWTGLAISSLAFFCGGAHSSTVSAVDAKANIYLAGASSVPGSSYGLLPTSLALTGPGVMNFSVTGNISLDVGSGSHINDADGFGAAVNQSSNTGLGSLSGMKAPGAGYLVGVFVKGTPIGLAPSALDFTLAGLGTSFASLAPELDQVFFIGDGVSGHGTGSAQDFVVPVGATTLYLGISDACGYNGAPSGCYADNRGQFNVTINQTPEPASLALAGLGLLGLVATRRKTKAA